VAKLLILFSIFAFSLNSKGESRDPQWTAVYLETLEGGGSAGYYKGSVIGYEKNYGKYFMSFNLKKKSTESTSNNLYGISIGAQPDWEFAGEPRISLGAGIGRGSNNGAETRSSGLSLNGEIVFKLNPFISIAGGIGLTSLKSSKESESGLTQESGVGLRILFY